MNAEVRISNSPGDLQLWNQRSRRRVLRVNAVHLWWTRTHERERYRVLSRIAALQVSRSVVRMRRPRVVLVGGRPVVVLRMIVIVVGVRVEQRRHAGRHNQRRDEQQHQSAVHQLSL